MITNFSRETTLKQRNTEQENSNSDTQNVFYFHAMSYFSRKQLELTMRLNLGLQILFFFWVGQKSRIKFYTRAHAESRNHRIKIFSLAD